MAESPRRHEICGEESEGGDVPQVGGVVLRFGGEVCEGCAGVDCRGEGEEGREGEG